MSELRSELWEKEMKLTDIRLEALNSAHQLEQLRETMHNMQVRTLASSLSALRARVPTVPASHHCAAAQGAAGIQLLTLCPTLFCPSWRWIS